MSSSGSAPTLYLTDSLKDIRKKKSLDNEIEITVILQNNGTETAKNALIVFTIDNINIGQHQVDMSPNEVKEEKFRTILNSPGTHTCSFEIIYD